MYTVKNSLIFYSVSISCYFASVSLSKKHTLRKVDIEPEDDFPQGVYSQVLCKSCFSNRRAMSSISAGYPRHHSMSYANCSVWSLGGLWKRSHGFRTKRKTRFSHRKGWFHCFLVVFMGGSDAVKKSFKFDDSAFFFADILVGRDSNDYANFCRICFFPEHLGEQWFDEYLQVLPYPFRLGDSIIGQRLESSGVTLGPRSGYKDVETAGLETRLQTRVWWYNPPIIFNSQRQNQQFV